MEGELGLDSGPSECCVRRPRGPWVSVQRCGCSPRLPPCPRRALLCGGGSSTVCAGELPSLGEEGPCVHFLGLSSQSPPHWVASKKENGLPPSSGGQAGSLEASGRQGSALAESHREPPSLPLPGFRCLQAIFGVPRSAGASPQSSVFTWCRCLHQAIVLRGHGHMGSGATLLQCDLIFTNSIPKNHMSK